MKLTRSAWLGILIACAGAVAFAAGGLWLMPTARPPREDNAVFVIAVRDVVSIEAEREGTTLEVVREGRGFAVTKPWRATVDVIAVDTWIRALVSLPQVEDATVDQTPDALGVPRAVVRAKVAAAEPFELKLELYGAAGEGIAARATQGSDVRFVIVPARAYQDVVKTAADVVERRILDDDAQRATSLAVRPDATLKSASLEVAHAFTIARAESVEAAPLGPRFLVAAPDPRAADATTAQRLLHLLAMPLSHVVVQPRLAEDAALLAALGLSPPALTVDLEIEGRDGPRKRHALLSAPIARSPTDPTRVVHVLLEEGVVGEADPALLEALAIPPAALDDRTLIDVDDAEVSRIELMLRDLTVVVERGADPGDDWRVLSPQPNLLPAWQVRALVRVVAHVVGVRREADGAFARSDETQQRTGLAEPVTARISLYAEGMRPMGTLRLGGSVDDEIYAQAEGRDLIVRAPRAPLERFGAFLGRL
jgi:hypothetical protein